MESPQQFFASLAREENGASASEYAVLVAIIIVAIAAALSFFNLGNIYQTVVDKVDSCVSNSTC